MSDQTPENALAISYTLMKGPTDTRQNKDARLKLSRLLLDKGFKGIEAELNVEPQ